MSLQIQTGIINQAQRITCYGPPAVGKSTLASQFPNPVFVDTEMGTGHLPVKRIQVHDYTLLCQTLTELRNDEFQTVVIDTIDEVEALLRAEVCREKHLSGMEALAYGKAWSFLNERFAEFLARYLDPLIAAGIHVVVLSHANTRKTQFPGMDSFDRWELRLYNQCASKLKGWSDAVLFLNFKIRVSTLEGQSKGLGGKERIIHTAFDASYDAKTRIPLPEELPLNFEAIKPVLCGWVRPPRIDPRQQFAEQLADLDQEQLRAFLLNREQLNDGQALTEIQLEYAREVLSRLSEFRQAVSNFDFVRMDSQPSQPEQKGGES
jgi:AAA domain-containing protein